MAKKVSRWHESIGPRLERVERRAAFDVHEYGTSILSKFPESDAQVRVQCIINIIEQINLIYDGL